jgi:plasmid stabilization system protein ParE
MSVNVIETTASRNDLRRILEYFLNQNEPEVAARFVDAYDETLRFIAEFPAMGIPWESDEERLKDLRVKLVIGFAKYLVFYRVAGDRAYVKRIFHGHQDILSLL